jgi:hypothetical protein
MQCEVVFTASDEDVTASLLANGKTVKLGLRANTSMGVLLAQSEGYTLDGAVASCTLSLNTSEIVALIDSLPETSRSTRVYFEVEVSNADGTEVQTLAQTYFYLQCEVNMEGDEPPTAASESQQLASESAVSCFAAAQATASDRQAVSADKETVQAFKASADADAQATASDRVAVAADKLTVAGDKATVQTLADQVASDKATVAADKETVAADKLAAASASAIAQTQAGVSTTQAGISTTKASEAAASAASVDAAGIQSRVSARTSIPAVEFGGGTLRGVVFAQETYDWEYLVWLYLSAYPTGNAQLTIAHTPGTRTVVIVPAGYIAVGKNGSTLLSTSTDKLPLRRWCMVGARKISGIVTYSIDGIDCGIVTDANNYDYSGEASDLGLGVPVGTRFFRPIELNTTLTAAERTACVATGHLPARVYVSVGAGVALTPTISGTTTGTVSASAVNVSTSGSYGVVSLYNTAKGGEKYRLQANITTGTGTDVGWVKVSVPSGDVTISALHLGANTVEFTVPSGASGGVYVLFVAPSLVWNTGSFIALGVTSEMDLHWNSVGLQIQDVSGAGRHYIIPITGVSPSLPPVATTAYIRAKTSTNGNQQLCGAAIIYTGANIVRVRARARTGTPNVTLGNVSGGSQIVASVALSTTWKQLAIAPGGEITNTTNIWAASNSTDVIEWDIAYELLFS